MCLYVSANSITCKPNSPGKLETLNQDRYQTKPDCWCEGPPRCSAAQLEMVLLQDPAVSHLLRLTLIHSHLFGTHAVYEKNTVSVLRVAERGAAWVDPGVLSMMGRHGAAQEVLGLRRNQLLYRVS